MQQENQNSYSIGREILDGSEERKTIYRIAENELDQYKVIGSGAGPIGMALFMGFKHSKNFFERVVSYTVSEEGIGRMMSEAAEKVLPELNKRQPEMRFTYTFYEKKSRTT